MTVIEKVGLIFMLCGLWSDLKIAESDRLENLLSSIFVFVGVIVFLVAHNGG